MGKSDQKRRGQQESGWSRSPRGQSAGMFDNSARRPAPQVAPRAALPTPGVPQLAIHPPAPQVASAEGGIVDGKTWQTGRVKSFDEDAQNSNAVEVGGVDYRLPVSLAKVSLINCRDLSVGTEVIVRLRNKNGEDGVQAIKLVPPVDAKSDAWYLGVLVDFSPSFGGFVERHKYRGASISVEVLTGGIDSSVICRGLRVEVQVDERGPNSPKATAIRVAL